MNQKSSLREDPKFVSWVLTGDTGEVSIPKDRQDNDQTWIFLIGLEGVTLAVPDLLSRPLTRLM
jgi:hypothetical protein